MENHHLFLGKLTISMTIFKGYVTDCQRVSPWRSHLSSLISSHDHHYWIAMFVTVRPLNAEAAAVARSAWVSPSRSPLGVRGWGWGVWWQLRGEMRVVPEYMIWNIWSYYDEIIRTNNVGITINHPWLGMVNIPTINGDDWGMVYDIAIPGWWWLEHVLMFPYIGNNHPIWNIFFKGVEITDQYIFGELYLSIYLYREWLFMNVYDISLEHDL